MISRVQLLFLICLGVLGVCLGGDRKPLDPQELRPPVLAGCSVFPPDNIWNQRVDSLPVHPQSAEFVASIGSASSVHPDFGSGFWPPDSDSPMGIPYTIAGAEQAAVPISFTWPDESDPGPYPIPFDAPIEGGPSSTGDRHVLVLDRQSCRLYELYNAFPISGGNGWRADSGAVFDLGSNALRPSGWTSADAAGLPILPGLIRYEEIVAGEIRHAIRFTAPRTRRAYVWPARHFASSLTSNSLPPMGLRMRLKASFNTDGFDPQVRIILEALKKYGMILADNGSAWYITGAPDPGWDNDALHRLHEVKGSDFEAVDVSPWMVSPDSGATSVAQPLVYPQLALGAGYVSILLVSNFSSLPWSGTAYLNGGAWPGDAVWSLDGANQTGETSFPIVLGPGETRRFLIGGETALTAGWLTLEPGPGVTFEDLATAFFFQFRTEGRLVDSTGVPSSPAARRFRFPVEIAPETGTGVAVRSASGPLECRLYDSSGELVAQTTRELDGASFVSEVFEDVPSSLRGAMEISGGAPFYATVLRQDIVAWSPLSFELTAVPAQPGD